MKAVTFEGAFQVAVTDVPEPSLQEPHDVILRVTTASICGTDIHVYNGRIPMPITGYVMGHEYVGEVLEVGEAVTNLKPGDRVVGAPVSSCGECLHCRREWPNLCVKGEHFGAGYLPGAQAERLRVPYGHFTLEKVSDGLPDEEAIFVGDILPTGYFAAERGEVRPGDVVVVVGSGPVGLCAQMCARLFQPKVIIAVDAVPERLDLARSIGSLPVDMSREDPGAVIREHTEGWGADVVLEAVGHEDSLRSCFQYVRPGGTISAVGVYTEVEFPFPMFKGYLRDLTFRIGACPVKNYMAKLLGMIERRELSPSLLITHTMPLAEAPHAYDIFTKREEGCVKVVLKP
jgi:S-(hydroxymethyl)glutathione dehydrogenase/alcohol dehydrogenase